MHTVIGSILAYLSVRFILPDWQYRNLSQLLSNALQSNEKYFKAIYSKDIDVNTYNQLRQDAHQADTALTAAWQSIKVEPKRAKHFEEQAFRLTYLNHTILSYISAFGAHNRNNEIFEENLVVCHEISDILSKANTNLLNKDTTDINPLIILKDADTIRREHPTRTMLLLLNIRRFAYELYVEAGKMVE